MGQEIVYCFRCSSRIVGADFDKGAAFQVGNHTACKACAQELLTTLPPEERAALQARMTRAAADKAASGSRLPAQKGGPRMTDTPRPTPRSSFPAVPDGPSKSPSPALIGGIIGAVVLIGLLGAFMMSGDKDFSPPRRDTGAAERAEWEATNRKEQEKEAAKKKEALSREFTALEEQLKELQFREEFKKGLDLLAEARNKHPEGDWQSLLDKRLKEFRDIPKGLYPAHKEKAIAARKRQAPAEVKVVEDRVAKWGLDEYVRDLRDALAAVVIEPPPFQESPEGLTVMEAENYHAKVDMDVSWTLVAAPAGFEGKGGLQALPNNNGPMEAEKAPRVDYKVNFVKTGVHYVWIRCAANDGTDDSLYFGMNGVKADTNNYLAIDAKKKWLWSNKLKNTKEAKIDVPSVGLHTFSVWPREDGAMIDRIVLTTQPKYPVAGGGPAESPR